MNFEVNITMSKNFIAPVLSIESQRNGKAVMTCVLTEEDVEMLRQGRSIQIK